MLFEDQHIRLNTKTSFNEDVFERCTFDGLDLSHQTLTSCRFVDCTFHSVDLSMIQWHQSQLQSVHFEQCKLMGVDFTSCSPLLFTVSFDQCNLSLVKFAHLDLHETIFSDCLMSNIDFFRTNLHKAQFQNCDLRDCLFESTNLSYADLSTSHSFMIDPNLNNVSRAKFSHHQLSQLLQHLNIEIV